MKKLLLFILPGVVYSGWFVHVYGQAESAQQLYTESQDALDKGDLESSRNALEQILEGDYQLSDYNMVLVRKNLGYIYYEQGIFQKANEHYGVADSLTDGSDVRMLNEKIDIYNNFGLLYDWMGDTTNSFSYYRQAFRLLDSIDIHPEDYFFQRSKLLLNKGIALLEFGRYQAALEDLKESGRIKEEHSFEYLGSVYYNLARIFEEFSDFTLALEYYYRSIHRWTEEKGEGYFQLGNVYLHYGLLLLRQDEKQEGRHFLDLAMDNYKRNYGIRHPLVAEGYQHIAQYHLERREYGPALENVQRSLIALSPGFENPDPFSNPGIPEAFHDLNLLKSYALKTKALSGMAIEYRDRDEEMEFIQAAIETNQYATDALFKVQEGYLSQESRTYLLSGQNEIFSSGIRLNIKAFQLSGKDEYKENAFQLSAYGKTNELLYEIRQKERLYMETLPDSLARSVIELQQSISRNSLLLQVAHRSIDPDSAWISELETRLFDERRERNRKMRVLLEDFPQLARFEEQRKPFSLRWVRDHMQRKTSLLEIFLADSGPDGSRELYLFTVTNKSLEIQADTLGADFQRCVERVIRDLYLVHPTRETRVHFDSLKTSLYGIYTHLILPVEPHIRGSHLVIAPDRELAYLPFEILLTRYEPDPQLNYAGLPYLMERYQISYLPNAQTMSKDRRMRIRFPRVNILLPDYSQSGTEKAVQLEGAKKEANEIMELTRANILQGPAHPSAIKKVIENNAVVHMAMHAVESTPEDKRSYFLLGNGDRSRGSDGTLLSSRLYDYEISVMNLNTPMVVLSGCSTGGGYLEAGEGIMSLSRSFILGGASSVVYSLWPVDDTQGQRLMTRFYRELKSGKSASKALLRAKQNYLQEAQPSYTHPYYWAAFQLTGNPGPVSVNPWYVRTVPVLLLLGIAGLYFRRRNFFRKDRTFSL